MRQHATAFIRRQLHHPELFALDTFDSVVLSQPLVQERIVAVDEIRERTVAAKHRLEEQPCLRRHRVLQFRIPFRKTVVVARDGVEASGLQPLADEVFGKSGRLRILDHAPHLIVQHEGQMQRIGLGDAQEFVIGHRTP